MRFLLFYVIMGVREAPCLDNLPILPFGVTYMNKNRSFLKKAVCILLLASLLTLSLASCEGESAYEIAVRNGFEGSESEWLESLVGKDGKDGKDGLNGQNGADGADGENGKKQQRAKQ